MLMGLYQVASGSLYVAVICFYVHPEIVSMYVF
jgi:hypothetical protein